MITVGGRTIEWREGLTLAALVQELGGAEGVSFATIEEPDAEGARRLFIRRLDWPTTAVADGTKIKLVVPAAGG